MSWRAWLPIAAYGAIVVLVTVFSVMFFYWRGGGATKGTVPAPTPPSRQATTEPGQKPVVRSVGPTTIDYRLYGRIASIDNEDHQGLRVGFVFYSDSLKTRIPVILRYHEQGYKLFAYEQNFGQTYSLRSVDGAALRQLVTNGVPLVELRVQFSKSNLSQDSANLMTALEAASQGNWAALPKSELMADSIGIVK